MSDFATSFGQLRVAVSAACQRHQEWPARVAAAIHAAIQFAGSNPAAALTLTAESSESADDDARHQCVIEHFAAMLGREAPRDKPLSTSTTDKALVGGIVTMVRGHLCSERADRLGELAPDLVQLTLLPYLGFAEAQRWAEFVG